MGSAAGFAPIRDLRDIEALERMPLEERIPSWDANDLIARGCALAPDKVALYFLEDADPDAEPARILYRELRRRSNQVANLLGSLGIGPGDPVAYLLPTIPEHYLVQLGALAAGIACCLNWMLKPAQLVELIRASRARVLFALGPAPGYEIWENVEAIRGELSSSLKLIAVRAPGGEKVPDCDFDDLIAAQPGDGLEFERRAAPEDIAAYIHSGGTTGSPKLVKLTHRGLAYKCWANTVIMAHTSGDVMFSDYPMLHIAGFFGRGILPVANGMSIVIPAPTGARDKRFVTNYWKLVAKYRVTIFSGVPTTLSVLAKNPPKGEDTSSLRPYMPTGSTGMPAEVAREIEAAIGVRSLLTFGATEFTQNVTQPPRDGDPRYGSTGIRIPYTQVKTVKLDARRGIVRDCAPGEIGEVVVKGPSITPGYLEPQYNEGLFTPDGWLISGDLGRLDADGYLWITGRAKDVIIRSGHNIDPSVIEEVLRRHPAVMLGAAVPKPDAYAGELPVAYVQLAKGATVSAEELRSFVRKHIAERAAAPVEIFVVDELPLTDVGKPAKLKLRYDAATRAFSAALAPHAGSEVRIAVEVGPDDAHGTLATIRVSAGGEVAREEIEARIREVMNSYTVAHAIVWSDGKSKGGA